MKHAVGWLELALPSRLESDALGGASVTSSTRARLEDMKSSLLSGLTVEPKFSLARTGAKELLGDVVPGYSRSHRTLDRFFRVRRVDGVSAELLAQSILLSICHLQRTRWGAHRCPANAAELMSGWVTLINEVLDWGVPSDDPSLSDDEYTRMPLEPAVPGTSEMDLWIAAHHVFFPFIQGLILVAAKAEERGGVETVERIRILFKGSISAMRTTNDIRREEYENTIRPSMAAAGHDFSGLFSVDHSHMLALLPMLKHIDDGSLRYVLEDVYDQHASVCEHLVGAHQPSLSSRRSQKFPDGPAALRGAWKNRAVSRLI